MKHEQLMNGKAGPYYVFRNQLRDDPSSICQRRLTGIVMDALHTRTRYTILLRKLYVWH
jgi:hypothetical protein